MTFRKSLAFIALSFVLMAGCGKTVTEYIQSTAADLSNLAVSAGTLTPAFSPDTTVYTVDVDNLQASITVTPTALEAGATITVNGSAVVSGSPSSPIALSAGINNIIIVVTASDTVTTKSYIVQVTKATADADLSNLAISAGTLSPAFSSNTLLYTVDVDSLQASVTVTPTAQDAGSTITVNGTAVASGAESGTIALSAGINNINIVVTASDAVTTKTYIVQVTKAEADADLISLDISDGTMTPAFHPDTTFYIVESATLTADTITVTPTASDSGATITVDGETVASGTPSSSIHLYAGKNNISTIVTAADGVTVKGYTVLVFKGSTSYLKASNTEYYDLFGCSVAISGDTIVVGAYDEDSSATGVNGNEADNSAEDSGAAYVFVRSGNVWSQQAYLKASNTDICDWFGYLVAIDGDTIVVGALWEDSSATGVNGNESDNSADESGAVYVFTRSGTVWSQQAYLKASNTDMYDSFGSSIAIDGDTIVVGASAESSSATGINGNEADNSASYSGAAYVFTRSGNVWSQQAYLKASNTEVDDQFGSSVSISADTIVVGAVEESSDAIGINGSEANNNAPGSGAAYVFTRSGTTWSQQAYLKASNTDAADWFGYSVAIDSDTIVVGAPCEDSNTTGVNGNETDNSAGDSGAAYIFTRAANVWSQQAYIKASNTDSYDCFGLSVSLSGDVVVAGALGESSSATGINGDEADNSADASGAVYTYTRAGSVWSQQAYLKASNTELGDWFCYSVSISGDTIVVGAYYESSSATGVNGNQADNSASGSGAAYVY